MKKTFVDSNNKTSTNHINKSDDCYIDDEALHLAAVAAAQDMLTFLRTSTNNLSYHEELHSPLFYRGLSLCIGAVQKQLTEGLGETDE